MTLVEYADLQCPYCAQWSRETLPMLVEDYVATGKLRIVFHGLAFIGPDSDKALRTAVAAGQDAISGTSSTASTRARATRTPAGSPTSSSREIAAGVPGLDGEKLLAARWEDSVEPELKRAAAAAAGAGVHGTPAFQIGPTGGRLELVQVELARPGGHRPGDRGGAGR